MARGASKAGRPADPWLAGWVAGATVVGVAAGLLVGVISQARRIAAEAGEIASGIEASRRNVELLGELPAINATVASVVGAVQASRQVH